MSTNPRLDALHDKAEAAQQRFLRIKADIDSRKGLLAEARARLADLGCDSLADADAKAAELSDDLERRRVDLRGARPEAGPDEVGDGASGRGVERDLAEHGPAPGVDDNDLRVGRAHRDEQRRRPGEVGAERPEVDRRRDGAVGRASVHRLGGASDGPQLPG